jgi:ferredoxin-NADP reductase
MASNQLIEVEVVARVVETPHITSLVLASKCGARLPRWEPGSHIDIVHVAGTRQYSLSGDRTSHNHWRVSIAHDEKSGTVSRYLACDVRVGDDLKVSTPRNNFPLAEAPHYVFLAGGIGITPILPMISAARERGSQWTLHYGIRNPRACAFLYELGEFKESVTIWSAAQIDLEAVIFSAPPSAKIYCCGPKSMIDETIKQCARLGKTESLHVERFSKVDHDGGRQDLTPFAVYCASSQVEFQVAPDESLLDALERNGVGIPSSCRSGTCGACEVPVLEGDVIHRDSIFSPAERTKNDRMFVCVSRCSSSRLVLDL